MRGTRRPTRAVWTFDFDGTLSEIVPERQKAVLHPDCRRMLRDLSHDSRNEVAILSSRTLEDLTHRIPFKKVTLIASSGLEVRLPDGQIRLPEAKVFRQANDARRAVLPVIAPMLNSVEGVELEDKMWSVAVHYRGVARASRPRIRSLLTELRTKTGLKLFAGPEATEIALLPQVDKSQGLRRLLALRRIDPQETRLLYAGDDQNDARAMRWVLGKRGTAIVVSNRVKVKRAMVVQGPAELAIKIMEIHAAWKQELLF